MANKYLFFVLAVFSQIFVYAFFQGLGKYDSYSRTWEIQNFLSGLLIFLGFGLQYSSLRKSSWTALSQVFYASILAVEFFLVFDTLFFSLLENLSSFDIRITTLSIWGSLFAAGAVVVSYGALVGRLNFSQLTLLAIIETIAFSLNFSLNVVEIGEGYENNDFGLGIGLHLFGTYFGLAASFALKGSNEPKTYHESSKVFTLIGTLIIWVTFPFFNIVVGESGSGVNTFVSLLGSTIATFTLSALLNQGKLSFESVSRATLAGGVGIASTVNVIENPAAAFVIGLVSGSISTFGFELFSKFYNRFVIDSAGIHYLHGYPALFGAIVAAFINLDYTGDVLLSIIITLTIAISFGLTTGFLLRFAADHHHGHSVFVSDIWAGESNEKELNQPFVSENFNSVNG